MPKPKTKDELLEEIKAERAALERFLAALDADGMTRPGAIGDWSAKDVLSHLAEWEQLLLVWYRAGLRGEIPALPAVGYNWGAMDDLNQAIYEKYRASSLTDVQAYFQDSYRQMLEAVESMSEDDLFAKGRFAWTKKRALLDYVIPCTSEHYQWARQEMRKTLRSRR